MNADTIQELADRQEIRDLMARYARGLDRRDFDAVSSLFRGGRLRRLRRTGRRRPRP